MRRRGLPRFSPLLIHKAQAMTDAPFSPTDYARTPSDRLIASGAAEPQPFHLTPDMINGLVVIGGSLVMALAGVGFGAWLQLPFGN